MSLDRDTAETLARLWSALDGLNPIEAEAIAVDPTFGPILAAAHRTVARARWSGDDVPTYESHPRIPPAPDLTGDCLECGTTKDDCVKGLRTGHGWCCDPCGFTYSHTKETDR